LAFRSERPKIVSWRSAVLRMLEGLLALTVTECAEHLLVGGAAI
jgi:hypothetical protein